MNTNDTWLSMLEQLLDAPVVAPRGKSTRELLGFKSMIPMSNPVVSVMDRKLGYRFMCAEAAWILSGDNRVSSIAPYSKAISDFSDDGFMFFGAYGPKIVQQLPYVVRSLTNDEYSRQAVVSIWRESPMVSKDIPCTITLQWMIRDGLLDCFANMRSSDVWLGIPYDWFNFSMISAYLLLILRRSNRFHDVHLGNLHLYAASQHLYETNWDAAATIADGACEIRHVDDLDLSGFEGPDDLRHHLWLRADNAGKFTKHSFMQEFTK